MTKVKKIEVDVPSKTYDAMIAQARSLGLRSRAELLRFCYGSAKARGDVSCL